MKLIKIVQNMDNVTHLCENCIFMTSGANILDSGCHLLENRITKSDFLICESDEKDYIFILEQDENLF